MLNGLDLFSGYGGISYALRDYVRPVAYCEKERYAQGILLSRIAKQELPCAPIWDDVTTLDGNLFRGSVDIIYGGFPCQDISLAGNGKGLAGERSGLFREIVRLAKEIESTFLFLENVPAIRTRGLDRVIEELTEAGYDLRWTMLSAAEVGAPHKRERWFLLAHTKSLGSGRGLRDIHSENAAVERSEDKHESSSWKSLATGPHASVLANALRDGSHEGQIRRGHEEKHGKKSTWENDGSESERRQESLWFRKSPRCDAEHKWSVEPNVGRVVDGCSFRMDRIKALGNGVVPLQVLTAFKGLMGLDHAHP